jgi:hypothetical protein
MRQDGSGMYMIADANSESFLKIIHVPETT